MEDDIKIFNLIELKKYDQALSTINIALSKNPEESNYYYLGSICHFAKDDIKLAKKLITEAIHLEPEENVYKLHLSSLYLHNDELKECSSQLNKIIPIDENEIEKKLELEAFLNLRSEDFNRAERLAKKALQLNPRNSNALGILGFTQLFLGSQDESINFVEDVLEIDPENEYARYVFVLNQLSQNKVEFSESTILNLLADNPSNHLYLDGLKFVLLSKNPISKIILGFRFFIAWNAKRVLSIYRILFRILLIGSYFFYINGNFLFGFSTALLLAHSIGSIPFKTIPQAQNLFLLPSKFCYLVIPKTEMIFSIGVVLLALFGFLTIYISPYESRSISIGLSAIYFSGLPFDYFYVIQKNQKRTFIIFMIVGLSAFVGLFVFDNKWIALSYLILIGFLIAYPIWKKDSSIKSI